MDWEPSEVPCKFPGSLKAGLFQRGNLVGAIGLEPLCQGI